METVNREQPTDSLEGQLDRLFAAYREACPDPEPSAAFMPRLWQRIEAEQSWTREFRRFTEVLVTAAAALSLLMGIFLGGRESPVSFYTNTYIEVLAANYAPDSPMDAAALPAEQEYF